MVSKLSKLAGPPLKFPPLCISQNLGIFLLFICCIVDLTSFVLRIAHECFLHGLRRDDPVLLLHGCCGGRGHLLLSDHLQGLDHGNVAQALGNGQSCLSILEKKGKV